MMPSSNPSGSSVHEAEAVFIPDDDQKRSTTTKSTPPVHVTTLEVVTSDDETLFLKGEPQPPAYRDVWFARAFLLQLAGVLLTAVFYLPSALHADTNDSAASSSSGTTTSNSDASTSNPWSVMWMVTLLAALFTTSTVSTLGLVQLMTHYAEYVVTASFFTAPLLLAVWALLLVLVTGGSPEGMAVGGHLLFFAAMFGLISACVYRAYKAKIPFAASTLQTALAALGVNKGLWWLSIVMLAAAFGWSALWSLTLSGLVAHAAAQGQAPCLDLYPTATDVYTATDMCDTHPPNGLVILFLVLSFYWTHQVITNVMHCTTSGTVGSWWFCGFGDPSWCSRDVTDSLGRSLTYSFGSICFGSLIVAILQLLESLARSARSNRRGGAIVACLLECILHCVRRWVEYFNSWAFVYVALYGYDYQTAGKNVMTLFQNRGWSSFVADRLVFRVLYSTKLAVGICCGGMAALADFIVGPFFPFSDDSTADAQDAILSSHVFCFYLGAFVGLITSSVSLFVMESAVRAVIVCFAEHPAEFQEHHPQLCETMRNGWAAAYPDVWNNGDYEERFVKATVVSYNEGADSSYSDDPLQSGKTSKASEIV